MSSDQTKIPGLSTRTGPVVLVVPRGDAALHHFEKVQITGKGVGLSAAEPVHCALPGGVLPGEDMEDEGGPLSGGGADLLRRHSPLRQHAVAALGELVGGEGADTLESLGKVLCLQQLLQLEEQPAQVQKCHGRGQALAVNSPGDPVSGDVVHTYADQAVLMVQLHEKRCPLLRSIGQRLLSRFSSQSGLDAWRRAVSRETRPPRTSSRMLWSMVIIPSAPEVEMTLSN